MSRAYRIRLSESLRRHIEVDDGICSSLELLDVLPREQMAGLLARELEAAGFEEREGQWVRTDAEGVEVRVDPQEGTVNVAAASDKKVEISKTREIRTYAEHDVVTRERAREGLQAELESELEAERKALQAKVTAKLEGKLGDLRQELDKISNRVTAQALKQKAASLGEVQEISEDPETGSLTIRVKL
jgi:gamma-glutamyl:cysteine ligase YbdK (ATP-grasp superfamily)